MRDAADQKYFVARQKNRWKIFERIFTVAYLNVISFINHEKDTTTEVYTELSQASMMEFFYEQE